MGEVYNNIKSIPDYSVFFSNWYMNRYYKGSGVIMSEYQVSELTRLDLKSFKYLMFVVYWYLKGSKKRRNTFSAYKFQLLMFQLF